MREILFRAKSKKTGKFVEGFYLRTLLSISSGLSAHSIILPDCSPETGVKIEEVDPSTLGELTPLKDSAGKRIWEGDIADIEIKNEFGSWEKIRAEMVMEDDGLFKFKWEGPGYDYLSPLAPTIVGNIHDNPDLLLKKDSYPDNYSIKPNPSQ